ncbi:MAG: hypothetical protein J0M12_00365 [Deltaproteobacteria bacterium]|nr:hypothetical protein [Deltaproteobacteria bacterium]
MLYPAIDDEAVSLFDIPNQTGTPERRLLAAILERAILDFVGNDEKEMLEAEEWLFSELETAEQHAGEFTFPWLCRELDLDVQTIAKKIKSMPKRGSHRIAPWYFAKAS